MTVLPEANIICLDITPHSKELNVRIVQQVLFTIPWGTGEQVFVQLCNTNSLVFVSKRSKVVGNGFGSQAHKLQIVLLFQQFFSFSHIRTP